MATMVLTVVGTALGGPIGGAVGAMLGQAIDGRILFAPKGRQGARLSDLRLQTSRYGDPIPRMFGTMRVAGSVIWATDLVERRSRQSAGKGQPKITTYSYSASFAVAISSRPVIAVRRIWADGNLLRGAAGDFKTALGAFRLHRGQEDQPLDPLIAAHKGMASSPAHRGIAYAVFEDLQLADYGNRIPSLTFEVVADDGAVAIATIAEAVSHGMIRAGAAGDSGAGGGSETGPEMVTGYAASGATAADALFPLVDGLDLAMRETADGGLVLTPPGTESEAVLHRSMIGAAFNGRREPAMQRTRGRAEDVPIRQVMHYYDPARDYQAGAQTAERSGAGRAEASLDLPAALEAGAARAMAQARLLRLWTGRNGLEVRCDWRALAFDPGMTLSVEGQAGRWRIEQMEWEAMGVRLRLGKIAGAGRPDLPASSGEPVLQVDGLHGPTSLIVADLPMATEEAATAPVVIAAAAGVETGWRAAELFVEDEASGGLVSLGGTAAPAIMGQVAIPPRGDVSARLFDGLSVVEVDLLHDGMRLFNADDAAMLAGANRALLGREMIQFGQASRIGERRWRLTRLLRGRGGTEWAMTGHAPGDDFLLLEEEALFLLPPEHVRIGTDLLMDAIGVGDMVPVQARAAMEGQALLPLSPVHARARQDADGWHFDWVRRSRSGWRWNDGVDAPLGEEQELYRLTLAQGGTLIRQAEVAQPRWTYDAAMIAGDRARGFGGAVSAEIRQVGTYGPGRGAMLNLMV
ncbi:MAG: phage tail protein [Sphingobium sp.]